MGEIDKDKEVTSSEGNEAQITLKINGKVVRARPGMTILDAARSAGIFIPTLCHHEKLSSYGACRLCIVEIVKRGRSRIVVSCIYPVEEGLEVLTESKRVVKHRKVILELILARWDWVDKDLLDKYGIKETRFEKNTTFCILCGLCVRHCTEVKKANVLGFVGRGAAREVVIYPELAVKECPTCGGGEMECLAICPTGVIPNDFAISVPRFGRKLPFVHPVKIHDMDSIRDILHRLGDLHQWEWRNGVPCCLPEKKRDS